MWSQTTIQLIQAACGEDLGRFGDITSRLLNEPEAAVAARVVPRADGVICGLRLGPEICAVFARRLERELEFEATDRDDGYCEDGQAVQAGETVATLRGSKAAVLAVERTLLNFLGRMSGVATLTHKYVEAARRANPDVQVLDTRKTIPGWRELDKYAVRMGGGTNHRLGLYDVVLIKDNHLVGVPTERLASTLFDLLNRVPTVGSAGEKVSRPAGAKSEPGAPATGSISEPGAPATCPPSPAQPSPRSRSGLGAQNAPSFVEVEVDNLVQLAEVCKVVGVDAILLDNFSLDDLRKAVEYRDGHGLRGKVALEASGKISLETIADIAGAGVDRISVGALTHSATSLDIGLDF